MTAEVTTYLVTGGAGFIGSAFVRYLLAAHPHARVVTLDALTYAGSLDNLRDGGASALSDSLRDGVASAPSNSLRDDGAVVTSFGGSHRRNAGSVSLRSQRGTHLDSDVLGNMGNANNALVAPLDNPRHVFVCADIRDRAAMDEVFATYNPTFVVNLAAESHVDRSIAAPAAFESTNVAGTLTLLDAARTAWELPDGSYPSAVRFLQVSTDEVYGSLALTSENAFCEDTPLAPRSPYAASKASADLFVRAYRETYGFPALITRCSNNYGPRQHSEKLIPHVIACCLAHEPVPLYGDGQNVRDWLYVDDHCRALDLVLEHGRVGEVYNIGCHNEVSNAELVRRVISEVARITGDAAITDKLIQHVADRPGHDLRYAIDPGKLKRELGWRPNATFDDALAQTVRWYVEHPNFLLRE